MTGIIKSAVSTAFVLALSTVAVTGYAMDKDKSSKSGSWPSFSKVDTDKSGSISMDEARAVPGLADTFTQYDKNNDGQLSKSEYESAKKSASKSSKSSSQSGAAGAGSSSSAGSSDTNASTTTSPSGNGGAGAGDGAGGSSGAGAGAGGAGGAGAGGSGSGR